MSVVSSVNSTTKVFLGLLTLGLIGLLFLIVFGNLSGNLGFSSGTQGYNNTEGVINNLTGGAGTFFTFSNVWFVLLAVTLLIIIVMGVVVVARSMGGSKFSS